MLFAEFVDGFEETLHVVGVAPVEAVDVALLVDEFVGGEVCKLQESLDGMLLLFGQVVVHAVGARQIVFLDDVLPRFVAAAVGQIEVDDVVVLQGFLHLPRLFEVILAGSAPGAPDVEIYDAAFEGCMGTPDGVGCRLRVA